MKLILWHIYILENHIFQSLIFQKECLNDENTLFLVVMLETPFKDSLSHLKPNMQVLELSMAFHGVINSFVEDAIN